MSLMVCSKLYYIDQAKYTGRWYTRVLMTNSVHSNLELVNIDVPGSPLKKINGVMHAANKCITNNGKLGFHEVQISVEADDSKVPRNLYSVATKISNEHSLANTQLKGRTKTKQCPSHEYISYRCFKFNTAQNKRCPFQLSSFETEMEMNSRCPGMLTPSVDYSYGNIEANDFVQESDDYHEDENEDYYYEEDEFDENWCDREEEDEYDENTDYDNDDDKENSYYEDEYHYYDGLEEYEYYEKDKKCPFQFSSLETEMEMNSRCPGMLTPSLDHSYGNIEPNDSEQESDKVLLNYSSYYFEEDDDYDEADDYDEEEANALPCIQHPRGARGDGVLSSSERLMIYQPSTEDPGSRLETWRPVKTTAGTVGSRSGRPVTLLRKTLGLCPSGKRNSARCYAAGSRRRGKPLTVADWLYLDLEEAKGYDKDGITLGMSGPVRGFRGWPLVGLGAALLLWVWLGRRGWGSRLGWFGNPLTSLSTYKLLMDEFKLSSLTLLMKITAGLIDTIAAVKLLK